MSNTCASAAAAGVRASWYLCANLRALVFDLACRAKDSNTKITKVLTKNTRRLAARSIGPAADPTGRRRSRALPEHDSERRAYAAKRRLSGFRLRCAYV